MIPGTAPSEASPLPPGLVARPLGAADLAQALALSREAGWNQTIADWRIFLELGSVTGVRRSGEDRLVASAATLPQGGTLAWISMVLVTAAERRRGIARWLLGQAVGRLRVQGLTPLLDATPAGRAVYLGLGFTDLWSLKRLVAAAPDPAPAPAPEGVVLAPPSPEDWPAIIAYDAAIFGAARGPLLRRLALRRPGTALVARGQGRLLGYLLGRDGERLGQLGPLAAEEEGLARALLARALGKTREPVAIDLPDRQAALGAWLAGLGFEAERPLIRMIHGRDGGFGDPARLFAIAGPELG